MKTRKLSQQRICGTDCACYTQQAGEIPRKTLHCAVGCRKRRKTQHDERRPSKRSAPRGSSPSRRKYQKACRNYLEGNCTKPSCEDWMQNSAKSECVSRHTEVDSPPSKKSKKSGGKRSVALLEGVLTIGLRVPRYAATEEVYGRVENWNQTAPSKSPRASGTKEKFGKERVHRKELVIRKCDPQERNPCGPRFEDKTFQETLHQERCARREAQDLVKNCLQAQNKGQSHVPLSCRSMGSVGTLFDEARGARIRGRLWSIDAHAEQKGFELSRTGNP